MSDKSRASNCVSCYNRDMKVSPSIVLLLLTLLAVGCAAPGMEKAQAPVAESPSATPSPPQPSPSPMPSPPPAPPLSQPLAAGSTVKLPEPRLKGTVSLEETLLKRRSVRDYADVALTLEEVSQLLWAGQGITDTRGGRTAPSAGATYPLEVYLVSGNVQSLAAGIYKYNPKKHELIKVSDGDVRAKLADAALVQTFVAAASIDIVIAAVYERTTWRYGDRGIRYVHIEVGHAAQNICLEAVALGLATVPVGAFHDDRVKSVLGLPANEVPIYILPVGRKP